MLQRELGSQEEGMAWALDNLAAIAIEQGDYAVGRSGAEEGLKLFWEGGNKGAYTYLRLVGAVLRQGDLARADMLAKECLAACQEEGDQELESPWLIATSLCRLASVSAIQGEQTVARTLYEQSLAIVIEVNKLLLASSLEGFAGTLVEPELTLAAHLRGAAEAPRESIGASLPPVEHAHYERSVAAARAKLGEQFFAAAWAEVRSMTPEHVLDARGGATLFTQNSEELSSSPA